ncbi:hypothetical protein SAMN04487948_10868 [Halogranum amylolyticum]|uniref:DUF7573 domain-containing protein n=1 Tax=Halogranum amylolyticum TaxID=660520 RepID=A0A1H8TRI5_9EURY|nr:hypothetical protein [Halogranum amylolyticum]SEO93507.1 hypothetical protein SAMN04487948_10868 [Halogranum amylolyticum]
MNEDRSLDDFVESNADETGEDESEKRAQTEPATPTYRFSPEGVGCDACDVTVQKRWQDDGRFVCADCKEW